ncbi:DNA-processing protein DprA [Agrobacterium pusense]|uniref:DNA-processing protein DprA n=1 Tax=Agrobacterium pusense TaxID=648995 RepID=UPI0035A6B5D3
MHTDTLQNLLHRFDRPAGSDRQMDLLRSYGAKDVFVHYSGEIRYLASKVVSIVGTRDISKEGILRANRLSRELSEHNVVVMSGLAKGVDATAHSAAIQSGGKTAAVIGTPLDRAYPAENATLQMEIYRHHLLLSPFAVGEQVYRSNFPARNRVMALLSDATVIVEASDTSGTLHQAAECQRSGRWLFIMKSVADDPKLTWPKKFLNHPKTLVLESTKDILEALA